MDIKFYNRYEQKESIEKVYGAKQMEMLYTSLAGKSLSKVLCSRLFSKIYGALQDTSFSRKKVKPFMRDFNIKISDFLPEEGRNGADPYSSFNQFFIRRFKEGKRNFPSESNEMGAFAEARYFGFKRVNETMKVPVKGFELSINELISSSIWEKTFSGGPLLLARLCPVDYHRFHFVDKGKVLDRYRIKGAFHSVNPLALAKKKDILFTNEREVTIVETENFGKLAYIDVGAICVGKIIQSYKDDEHTRGEEKGYFLFGGSTVIVIGEERKWIPAEDITNNTKEGMETYIHLGDLVARKVI